jgi:hypothetical protein
LPAFHTCYGSAGLSLAARRNSNVLHQWKAKAPWVRLGNF